MIGARTPISWRRGFERDKVLGDANHHDAANNVNK